MDKTAINISFSFTWKNRIDRSGNFGFYGKSDKCDKFMFNFIRNFQTIFQSGCGVPEEVMWRRAEERVYGHHRIPQRFKIAGISCL